MSVRRRDLIAALAVLPAVVEPTATAKQSPPPLSGAPAADRLQKDLQSIRETSQKLSQLSIPIQLEPAFTFKA